MRQTRSVAALLLCLCSSTVLLGEPPIRELQTDLLIVGATESGWAAAIQAARMGTKSITLVHDGRWVGGQFTEQALACVDENKGVDQVGWGVDWHPMKRSFHRSGLFKELMDRIESFNTDKYGAAMPGRPYHGPSTFRPIEAEAIFRAMLQPYIDRGQIRLLLDRYPVAADVESEGETMRFKGLTFAPLDSEQADLHVSAKLTIDASDWGEAIQLSGAAFECGPDPKSRYHEPSAPEDLAEFPPAEMNPITWAMIIEECGQESPIARPDRFDDRNFARATKISRAAMQNLEWDRPTRLGGILHWPDSGQESPRQLSVYNVRRLVDGRTSKEGQTLILLNYMLGQDYPLERLPAHVVDALEATEQGAAEKNIVRMSRRQRQIIFDDAKRHSLCLLHHFQTFVHDRADDTTNSFRSFRLSDEFETPDRLPPKPYIRESLRLKAMYMMREQDGRNADGNTKTSAIPRFSRVMYPDGVLCWQFHYDFHRTGRAYLKSEGEQGPWIDFEKPGRHTHHVSDRSVFPLRSLIPEHMDGLLGAQKNVGYSSIVCAAIRLHDQCIAIGQAAGATAAIALDNEIDPRSIPYSRDRLEDVRRGLCGSAGEGAALLLWPFRDLSPDHDAFVAINRLAAMGVDASGDYDVDFKPDEAATSAWQEKMIAVANETTSEQLLMDVKTGLTRGELCCQLWSQLESLPLRPFPRHSPQDADDDGIPDQADPTPFSKAPVVVWSVRPPGPAEDGIPESVDRSAVEKAFNFTPLGSVSVEGFTNDYGHAFSDRAGKGWREAIEKNSRRRGALPEDYRDTFLFTRDSASWECEIDNGSWQVTVCVGDPAHEQIGQRVTIEGVPAIVNETTPAGRFLEVTVNVDVKDGRLTMELGPQQRAENTCVNWLQISR